MAEERRKYTREEIREVFKDGLDDYFIGHLVFENVGYIILRIVAKTRITPNQITWMWGILMTVSSLLLVFNDWRLNILAGVGWIVAYSMDYMDGAWARLCGVYSKRGAFLDLINHSVNYPLLYICMGIGVWRTGGCPYFDYIDDYWYIFMGIVGGISCVLVMLMPTLFRRVNPEETVGCSNEIEGGIVKNHSLWLKLMNFNPLAYVNMMFLILVFAIADQMWLYVILFSAGYFLAALGRFTILYRKMPARITQ